MENTKHMIKSEENAIVRDIWRPRPHSGHSSAWGRDRRETDEEVKPGGGCKVYIYKQDPRVKEVGYRQMWLPVKLERGPRTNKMRIMGMPADYSPSDTNEDWLYKPHLNRDAFDAIHTLAVANHVYWMYERALLRIGWHGKMRWHWHGPLYIYPNAGNNANAYYSRGERALKFFTFTGTIDSEVKTCRSWDVVSHETGHAILDLFQPYWGAGSQESALHESFGDLTAIFSILDQMDMCEMIVTHAKGDLKNRDNILATIGEEFAHNTGKPFGLRNAAEDLRVSMVYDQPHDYSRVFTGAVYDVMIKIYEESFDIQKQTPAETLYYAARHTLSLVLKAFIYAPRRNPRFMDLARYMIKEEPEARFKDVIHNEFERREVFSYTAKPRWHPSSGGGFVESSGQCGTLAELRKAQDGEPVRSILDEDESITNEVRHMEPETMRMDFVTKEVEAVVGQAKSENEQLDDGAMAVDYYKSNQWDVGEQHTIIKSTTVGINPIKMDDKDAEIIVQTRF